MKTYYYVIKRNKPDINGNSRHRMNLFRLKRGRLVLLNDAPHRIYTSAVQDACAMIEQAEKWPALKASDLPANLQPKEYKDVNGRVTGVGISSGFCYTAVSWALHEGKVQIFEIPVP